MRFLRFATSTVLAATLLTGGIQGTAAEVRVAETDGQVSFVPNDRDPTEVLPPDPGPDGPDVEIPPIGPDGQTGPLTIAYAPTLDFGTQEISNRDAVYSMVAEKQQLADTPRGRKPSTVCFLRPSTRYPWVKCWLAFDCSTKCV